MKVFYVIFVIFIGILGHQQVSAQAAAPVPFTPTQIQCIRSCPRITNYNPICGTDGFLYDNMGHLNCAVRCGYNVQAAHGGRCTPFLNLPTNQRRF